MSARRCSRCLSVFVVTVVALGWLVVAGNSADDPPAEAAAAPAENPETADPHAEITAALAKKGDWAYADTPLEKVLADLREKTGVDFAINVAALDDYGVPTDLPVTCNLKGITLRSFLRLILHNAELTYEIHDGALWVTTPEEAESRLTVRTYEVGDLIRLGEAGEEGDYDYDTLTQMVMSVIAPDTWDQVGGPGSIQGIYGSLVLSQTREVHEEIERLFVAYREVAEQFRRAPQRAAAPLFLGEPSGNSQIRAALDRRVSLDIEEKPLHAALDQISNAVGITMVADQRGLEDYGIGTDTPVSLHVKNLPLRYALHRAFYELELTWTVRDEVLIVTTPEASESSLTTCIYPVWDLVAPLWMLEEAAADQPAAAPDPRLYDFDSLIEALTSTVEPDAWDEVGGPGSVEPIPMPAALVISQTEDVHEKLIDLLAKLRQAKASERDQQATARAARPSLRMVLQTYPLEHDPGEVLQLLVKVLGEEIWEEEGAFVQPLGGSLVIRHTTSVHRRIEKALTEIGAYDPWGGGRNAPGGLGGGMFGGLGGGTAAFCATGW